MVDPAREGGVPLCFLSVFPSKGFRGRVSCLEAMLLLRRFVSIASKRFMAVSRARRIAKKWPGAKRLQCLRGVEKEGISWVAFRVR